MRSVINVGGPREDVELVDGRDDFAHDYSEPIATGIRFAACKRQ
jgi:hypothetical protein